MAHHRLPLAAAPCHAALPDNPSDLLADLSSDSEASRTRYLLPAPATAPHGGAETFATAARAGTPMLVVPCGRADRVRAVPPSDAVAALAAVLMRERRAAEAALIIECLRLDRGS